MITDIIEVGSVNRVIVVGMLDTMLVRDRTARRDKETGRAKLIEVTRREGRDRGTGGRWEHLTLQVRSPYGGMFALPIEIEPDVPGAELIASAKADTLLAVEGGLQLVQTFDARFASDRVDQRGRSDRGRPTRTIQLRVTCVREPDDAERRAGSAVWLTGEVAEPPQVTRHPDLPSVQLAGTVLRVTEARPSGFPGLPATVSETVEVNVAVPTSHADAGYLYRHGNVVRVAGQLDCRMETLGGQSVRDKLAELDAEWAARREELVEKPVELRRAEEQHRRLRQRFEASPRLYVLVGGVVLIDGEALALDETYEARRAFVRERRQRQEARRAQVGAERVERAERRDAHAGTVATEA